MVRIKVIIEVLREASRLLQQKGWNKYSMARNEAGDECGLDSPEAACFCLSGALVRAWRAVDPSNEDFYFTYFEQKFSEVLRTQCNYNRTFTQWNDNVATSREDVVNLIHCVVTSLPVYDVDVEHEAESLSARLTA